MDRLRVRLLGAFSASRGDAVLSVPGARLQGLLVRLALAGGRPVESSVLVEAIWGEDPPAHPAPALQALVSRLRRVLGSPTAVTQIAGSYRLAVDPDDVDALRFEHLTTTARDHLRAGDPSTAATLLMEALTLTSGEAATGSGAASSGGAWATGGAGSGAGPAVVAAVAPGAAIALERVAVEAVVDLGEAELALGRVEEAAARLTALVSEQPVHERATGLLIDALAAQGRQADALAVYERMREALADRLGADPGTALQDRHLSLLRAERPVAPTTNLPAPLTSFIGRHDDLDRVDALLTTGRLVTVLGPGGAGKTRLAIEAARRHPNGVRMIDLASVTEPAKLGTAVLAAAGLRGGALFEARLRVEGDELDLLVDRLGDQQTLLLIDNCEHLIDAVAHLVAALLTRAPVVRVLATSREPLAIDGEALVPLGPLPLPAPDADVEQARRTASVRLFSERAAAVKPGFEVSEHNLDEVLRVVRSLDGLPLALELAAARLRTLSLTDVAAGLSDRFALLTTGSRVAFPRHRTLRGVIAWSWDLLDADARTVAERVAVLPGGITYASAAAVCRTAVDDVLADLVERSLLQLTPEGGRYRMLETIREYGLERLAEQGTLDEMRDRAADYFAELVAHYDALLRGPDQLDALAVLGAEYENVFAALRHLCDRGDATGAIGLAVNLTWYGQLLGRHHEATYWLGEAVAIPVERPGLAHDIAQALLLLIDLATPSAPETLPERQEKLRTLTDRLVRHPESLGPSETLVAVRLATLDRTGTSAAFVQRLVDGPDVWLAGLARLFRAQLAESEGELGQAGEDVTVALECFTRTGDRWGLATALPLRSLLRQYDGDLDGALADLNEAKRLAREFGSLSLSDEIFVDLRWSDLYVRLGDPARAAEAIVATRERVQRSATPDMAILLDAMEAGLRVLTGELDRARTLIDAAATALADRFPGVGDHGQALVSAADAVLRLELGDRPGAREALRRAHAAAVESRDGPLLATVTVTLAGLAEPDDDVAVLLGAAARLRGAHDRTDPRIRSLAAGARAALGDEKFDAAYERGWRFTVEEALTRADPEVNFTTAGPSSPV
ncbi:BTAD domain-containing putative transcriptional regulator [Cryptosporangium sp. NPDC048952]|uniref:BTAD domain-containing putative transcriptional regulator n=1 Tax=Cryptosporangium sp. NPDC048952 TaxID=3363961 RepID=UPI00371796F7